MELLAARYVYLLVLVLLAIGLYGMLAIPNLAKKVVGMVIFQTAIYLFFIEGSVKRGGTVPVITPEIGSDPAAYVNPLPHLLILTAIVVGVGVLGVALALIMRLHRAYGTLDEDALIARASGAPQRGVPAAPDRTAGGAPDEPAGEDGGT